MKRAYRRHKKHVKFLKRLNKWIKPGITRYAGKGVGERIIKTRIETIKEALAGTCYTFLRTTGSPCNCAMCQYEKYKREPRYKWLKEVKKEINENE